MEQTNDQVLFMQLVIQNQQIALMSLGKMKNPLTDKSEINLEYAKLSIDTLDMLLNKTNGNLSDYEEKFLTEVIKELKLSYVEELGKEQNVKDTKQASDKS